jgi:hypothetical protein
MAAQLYNYTFSNMDKPMRKFHPETKENAFFMLRVNI